MTIYVQLGAGAGDQDSRLNYTDGFTNFIKQKRLKAEDKIILVEPNSFNLDFLKTCWKNYKNAEIYNIGIVPDSFKEDEIKFFYAKEDAPCYQVFSHYKKHVVDHYPNSEIQETIVKVKKISDFLKEISNDNVIDYLSIDVEGMDAEILLSIDLENILIKNISIEFLHLGLLKKNVLNKLIEVGYSYSGKGFDPNGYDEMFTRKKGFFSKIKTKKFLKSINIDL